MDTTIDPAALVWKLSRPPLPIDEAQTSLSSDPFTVRFTPRRAGGSVAGVGRHDRWWGVEFFGE
jgi:hypothetical protein